MQTLPVSQFKARCLGLIKQVQRTGNPIRITLRGRPLAMISPCTPAPTTFTVAQSLAELRPLLLVGEPDLILSPRRNRHSSLHPLND